MPWDFALGCQYPPWQCGFFWVCQGGHVFPARLGVLRAQAPQGAPPTSVAPGRGTLEGQATMGSALYHHISLQRLPTAPGGDEDIFTGAAWAKQTILVWAKTKGMAGVESSLCPRGAQASLATGHGEGCLCLCREHLLSLFMEVMRQWPEILVLLI